jgi:hypothetical protein
MSGVPALALRRGDVKFGEAHIGDVVRGEKDGQASKLVVAADPVDLLVVKGVEGHERKGCASNSGPGLHAVDHTLKGGV